MKPLLVFDIETIPDIDGIRKIYNFDKNLSETEVFKLVSEKRLKEFGNDFLPLHLHRIVAISCLFRNKNIIRIKTLGKENDSEESIILMFFRIIDKYMPKIITWNGSGFDLPVIHYRSLIHKVTSERYWDLGDYNKEFKFNNYINRYHNRHFDLMDVLAKYNARANVPMDEISKLCGFPGKIGMDGSMVWDAWCNGELNSIRSYCEIDVVNTWLLYCRFCLLKGDLDSESYLKEMNFLEDTISKFDEEHWVKFLNCWDR